MMVQQWLIVHKLRLNIDKSKFILFGSQSQLQNFDKITISYKDQVVTRVQSLKLLGVTFNSKLTWDDHVQNLIQKTKSSLRAFMRGTRYMDIDTKKMLYNAILASRLNYADIIWDKCGSHSINRLQTVQNIAIRFILNADSRASTSPLLTTLNWLPLHYKRKLHCAVMMYKIINDLSPPELKSQLLVPDHRFLTRSISGNSQQIHRPHSTQMMKSFFNSSIKIWNDLPNEIRKAPSWMSFKNMTTKFYLKID